MLLTGVAALLLADLIREFIANDAIRYFSSEPVRLLIVLVIALGGGALAYAFGRLSGSSQNYLKLVILGLASSGLTLFAGWLAFKLFLSTETIHPRVAQAIDNPSVYIAQFMLAAAAAFLWFQFFRAWRCNRRPERPRTSL